MAIILKVVVRETATGTLYYGRRERSDTSKKKVEEHVSKKTDWHEIPDEPSDAKLNRWRDDAVILDDLRDELKTHLEEKGGVPAVLLSDRSELSRP